MTTLVLVMCIVAAGLLGAQVWVFSRAAKGGVTRMGARTPDEREDMMTRLVGQAFRGGGDTSPPRAARSKGAKRGRRTKADAPLTATAHPSEPHGGADLSAYGAGPAPGPGGPAEMADAPWGDPGATPPAGHDPYGQAPARSPHGAPADAPFGAPPARPPTPYGPPADTPFGAPAPPAPYGADDDWDDGQGPMPGAPWPVQGGAPVPWGEPPDDGRRRGGAR